MSSHTQTTLRALVSATVLVAAASARSDAQGTTQYQATPLTESGTNQIAPAGIDYANRTVGAITNPGNGLPNLTYGFLRTPNPPYPNAATYNIYNYPDYSHNTYFTALNRFGYVTGYSLPSDPNLPRTPSSFIFVNGTFSPFQVLNTDTWLTGINSSGIVVGYVGFGGSGFSRNNTTNVLTTFTFPNSLGTFPYGINDAGIIVGGYLYTTPSIQNPNVTVTAMHAFALINGNFYNIDPGGFSSNTFVATGINNNNQVSITTSNPATLLPMPINYTSAYVLNLNTLFQYGYNYYTRVNLQNINGNPYQILGLSATAINDSGYITGVYETTNPNNYSSGYIAAPPGDGLPDAIVGSKATTRAQPAALGELTLLGPSNPRFLGKAKILTIKPETK